MWDECKINISIITLSEYLIDWKEQIKKCMFVIAYNLSVFSYNAKFPRLTAAFFISAVLAVLLPVADLTFIDALAWHAHVLVRCTGGLGCDTQAVHLIWPVHAVSHPVTSEGVGDAGPVTTGELITSAGVISTTKLITAVSAVVHTVTAGEEELCIRLWSVRRELCLPETS